MNAGGPQVAGGPKWVADTKVASPTYSSAVGGGFIFSTAAAVALDESVPPETPLGIFKTHRFDTSAAKTLSWDFRVANAEYEVTLFFAEIFHDTAGACVFEVTVEGSTIVTDFDVVAVAGGPQIGIARTTTVKVSDGNLDTDMTGQVGTPSSVPSR